MQNFSVGVYSAANVAGSVSRVAVTRSVLSGNNHGGAANASGGGSATLVLDDSTISHNTTAGVFVSGGGVIQTRGNNVFNFNNGVDVSGGVLTPLAGQ